MMLRCSVVESLQSSEDVDEADAVLNRLMIAFRLDVYSVSGTC